MNVLLDVLRQVKAMLTGTPAGKVFPWAVLFVGIGAAAAIVLRMFGDPQLASFALIGMLVLMAVAVVLLRVTTNKGPWMQALGIIFAYAAVILILFGATLLMTSYFFGWPRAIAPSSGRQEVSRFDRRIQTAPPGDLKMIAEEIRVAADKDDVFARLHSIQDADLKSFFDTVGEPLSKQQEATRDGIGGELGNRAIVLAMLGPQEPLFRLLEFGPDLRIRSYLISRLPSDHPDAGLLVEEAKKLRQGQPHAGIRQALILVLYHLVPPDKKGELIAELRKAYREDPDSGVHSAIDWLLGQWGRGEEVRKLDSELALTHNEDHWRKRLEVDKVGWGWFVGPEGHTMIVFPDLTVEMGLDRSFLESIGKDHTAVVNRGKVSIPAWFAVTCKEVTKGQFLPFVQSEHLSLEEWSGRQDSNPELERVPPEGPATSMTWEIALRYCDWLTRRTNKSKIRLLNAPPDLKIHNFPGYRLPSEAEWLCACKAGTVTFRFYGFDDKLMSQYAWDVKNSNDARNMPVLQRVGTKLPNPRGLFDMYGNAEEMCLDSWVADYPRQPYLTWLPPNQRCRPARGGSISFHGERLYSAWRREQACNPQGEYARGFRIAQTLILNRP